MTLKMNQPNNEDSSSEEVGEERAQTNENIDKYNALDEAEDTTAVRYRRLLGLVATPRVARWRQYSDVCT